MASIEFQQVSVVVHHEQIISNFNARIETGSFTVFSGESGSGKSILLDLCAQKLMPNEGEVKHSTPSNRVAYLQQNAFVQPHQTAFQLVARGLLRQANWFRKLFKKPSFSDYVRVMDYLEKVNLLKVKDVRLDKLSGGERRRIEIAQVIIQDASIYVFDEPIAGLDPNTANQILLELHALTKEQGKTVICTISQLELARRYATNLFTYQEGEWKEEHFPG